MDKKIVTLLNNNLRVIIPDFGAFIIKQQEPQIIVFNEALMTNDGILIDYIMKTENVDIEIASQILNDYTTYALRTLETGNSYTISGLGTLRKEKNGKISFIQENDLIDLDETETKDIKSTVDKSQSTIKQTEFRISDIASEPQNTVSGKDNELQSKEEYDASEAKNFRVTFIPRQAVKWAVVILLVNITVLAIFAFRNKTGTARKSVSSSALIENAVLEQLNDSMMSAVQDTSLIMTSMKNLPVKDDSVQNNIRYYIVAGCFRDEINADELVKGLKNMGYDAEKFGKIGELYAVSFSSYSDKEIAVKELAKIREDSYPDAWMTRF